MTSSSLPIAFWQLLYPWFANAVVARSIQLSLIFHAVAANTPSAWMSAMLAAGATMSTLFAVPVEFKFAASVAKDTEVIKFGIAFLEFSAKEDFPKIRI